MPNWAGYDTASFLYSLAPRADPQRQQSCNPSSYTLASYIGIHYTQSADKYFARYFLAPGFATFDPQEIPTMRAATFYALMPISAPTYARLTTSGLTGKQFGQEDAFTTLDNVEAALASGRGLVIPSSATVYVYLNIEQGYPVTAWYWEGWSEIVYAYHSNFAGVSPYLPAAYANKNDTTTMNMLVSYNGDAQHTCYGLWTTQPNASDCQSCNNAPPPNWSSAQGYTGLTLHHWQYTLDELCYPAGICDTNPPSGSCCDSCRPHVDQDQSNPSFDMAAYMLQVI